MKKMCALLVLVFSNSVFAENNLNCLASVTGADGKTYESLMLKRGDFNFELETDTYYFLVAPMITGPHTSLMYVVREKETKNGSQAALLIPKETLESKRNLRLFDIMYTPLQKSMYSIVCGQAGTTIL